MFVGHIGAGLMLKQAEPRLNLGLLVFAALFADLLLWLLVLARVESVLPPLGSGAARYFSFEFPYSHGLVATIAWSVLAGVAVWWLTPASTPRRVSLAVVVALAVSSHFVLDFVVHVPDLPVLSEALSQAGLGFVGVYAHCSGCRTGLCGHRSGVLLARLAPDARKKVAGNRHHCADGSAHCDGAVYSRSAAAPQHSGSLVAGDALDCRIAGVRFGGPGRRRVCAALGGLAPYNAHRSMKTARIRAQGG